MADELVIRGLNFRNLRDLNCALPKHRLVTVCGPSGSGKSTLLFDVIAEEGERRLLLSQGQAVPPPLADIKGLGFIASLDRLRRVDPNQTLIDLLGVSTDLAVQIEEIGSEHCVSCQGKLFCSSLSEIERRVQTEFYGSDVLVSSPLPRNSISVDSFNELLSRGFTRAISNGELCRIEELIQDRELGGSEVAIAVDRFRLTPGAELRLIDAIKIAADIQGGIINVSSGDRRLVFFTKNICPNCGGSQRNVRPLFAAKNRCPVCRFRSRGTSCASCGDLRYLPEVANWQVWGEKVGDIFKRPISAICKLGWEDNLRQKFEAVSQLGVGYLALNRLAGSLSSGELQRLRLARSLDVALSGVTYLIDEPTSGMSVGEVEKFIEVARELLRRNNTLIVSDHSKALCLASDYLLELGPGGGRHGGQVVAKGAPDQVLGGDTFTARAFRSGRTSKASQRSFSGMLQFQNLRKNNLQIDSLELPLGALVVVKGISGSGKSSLVFGEMAPRLISALRNRKGAHNLVEGWQGQLSGVIPFSTRGEPNHGYVFSLLGLGATIAELYRNTLEAKVRGISKSELNKLLASVAATGFKEREAKGDLADSGDRGLTAVELRYRGLTVRELLSLSLEELFEQIPILGIQRDAATLVASMGIGYLPLGQRVRTLSSGELQRVRLLRRIFRGAQPDRKLLFLLDEPSRGLHEGEVAGLVECLRRLISLGHSVVAIEHNSVMIEAADCYIELGPGAGTDGGRVVRHTYQSC